MVLLSENFQKFNTELQEEVRQHLDVSAWILHHFLSEYGTIFGL